MNTNKTTIGTLLAYWHTEQANQTKPKGENMTTKKLSLADLTECFYSPSTLTIIDFIHNGRGVYGRDGVESCLAEWPDAAVWNIDAAIEHKEQGFTSGPREITHEEFIEALECLPPEDWQHTSEGESFKMCERTSGNITAIYARVGERYFVMDDAYTTRHATVMALCLENL